MDGVDAAGAFFATMADCSDVETTESDRPFLYGFRNFYNGSYGHGKQRGGAGLGFSLIIHDTPFFMMGSHGGGSKFPTTQGLFGGYGLPSLFVRKVAGSNVKDLLAESDSSLPSRLSNIYDGTNPEEGDESFGNISAVVNPVQDGDAMYSYVGGGAGLGDVLEREPQSIMKDLTNGLVSHWAAKNIYHLVYDEVSLRLDVVETKKARSKKRQARIASGVSFHEFSTEWEKKSPPAEILTYYGDYPNPGTKALEV